MTDYKQEIEETINKNLEDILGQNYVDEYSGSNKHIGVDEIAKKLTLTLTHLINKAKIAELGKMPMTGSKALDTAYFDKRIKELEGKE